MKQMQLLGKQKEWRRGLKRLFTTDRVMLMQSVGHDIATTFELLFYIRKSPLIDSPSMLFLLKNSCKKML